MVHRLTGAVLGTVLLLGVVAGGDEAPGRDAADQKERLEFM
jgi:hypothetical protein